MWGGAPGPLPVPWSSGAALGTLGLPPLPAQLPEVQPFGVETKGLQSLAAKLLSTEGHGTQETRLLAPPPPLGDWLLGGRPRTRLFLCRGAPRLGPLPAGPISCQQLARRASLVSLWLPCGFRERLGPEEKSRGSAQGCQLGLFLSTRLPFDREGKERFREANWGPASDSNPSLTPKLGLFLLKLEAGLYC